ncbi:Acyl-CoA synthetase family member 3 [Talaromyces pinophilus]|nr:Acyl-CoA synthetase family member 3 [Talaromyces pinophilus]
MENSAENSSAQSPKHIDRTELVPQHAGDCVLPNFTIFTRLIRFASQSPSPIAIRDVNSGQEKTYLQLLTDILALRKTLVASLAPSALKALSLAQDIFIGLLAPGGYEYTVGFITILSLGAAVVPMATSLPVKEASYFLIKSRCAAVLTGSTEAQLGQSLVQFMNEQGMTLTCIEVTPHLQALPLPPASITISSDAIINPNGAGLVIFTSGTTGPPKAAVQRRGYISSAADSVAHHYGITSADTILHVLPVHHATGIGISFLPFILSGACVEFRSGSFDERWAWERWRKGGLTIFSGVPTIYMRMKRHYDQVISKLLPPVRDQYIAGAQRLRALICGSSAFPTPVEQFWARILGGKRILTRYGATEIGAVFAVDLDASATPEGSVGRVMPGVTVKLSEGNEGLVLVKGPHMFSGYLFDQKATAAAHDEDGFFLTGDIARREGSYFYILGRASIDIIKSGGYKISALDVEREILGLPYVSEVMVVGVEDEEFGQRVAAAISTRDVSEREGEGRIESKDLTIAKFRNDLRSQLTSYKIPTLLRIIKGGLPKSSTGKVQKKILGPQYFPPNYRDDPNVQTWSRREMGDVACKL